MYFILFKNWFTLVLIIQIVSIKAYTKDVNELTEFCKNQTEYRCFLKNIKCARCIIYKSDKVKKSYGVDNLNLKLIRKNKLKNCVYYQNSSSFNIKINETYLVSYSICLAENTTFNNNKKLNYGNKTQIEIRQSFKSKEEESSKRFKIKRAAVYKHTCAPTTAKPGEISKSFLTSVKESTVFIVIASIIVFLAVILPMVGMYINRYRNNTVEEDSNTDLYTENAYTYTAETQKSTVATRSETSTASTTDKYINDWTLMSSPWPTVYLTLTYLLLVTKILPSIMRNRREFDLKHLILLYNLFSIVLNVYMAYKVVSIKIRANDFGLCTSIKPQSSSNDDEYTKEITRVSWLFYISKLIEFLDTIFFILRKRFHHLSALHIYHHSTMFPIWWIVVNYLADGTTIMHVLVNSIIHSIMYVYYAISMLGPEYRKWIWWKRYLTMLQMLQFCALITYASILLHTPCGYKLNDRVIWFSIYYSLTHLILFFNFYTSSYYKRKMEPHKHHNGNGHTKSVINSTTINSTTINSTYYDNDLDQTMNTSHNDGKFLDVSRRRPLRSPASNHK